MNTTSSASTRTSDQEKALRRMVNDLAEGATTLVLEKVDPTKEGLQRMLEKGDVWGRALKETLVAQATTLCDLPLRYLQSVSVAETERLVITKELLRERFNIGYVGTNATRLLVGKILPEAEPQTLAVRRLEKWQTGQQLKDELGVGGIEVIASMLALVEQQKNGPASPEGILLTNGYANVAVVEIEGTAWAFSVYWGSGRDYWVTGLDPLVHGWRDGRQVFSHDC